MRTTVLGELLDILFPPLCPLCEEALTDGPFCAGCLGSFQSKEISAPICRVCGVPFPKAASAGHTCGECITGDVPFTEARSAFYYDDFVANAIHRFKYRGDVILGGPLGRLALGHAGSFSSRPDLIIPVPLHKKRLQFRGFNQSLLLARELAGSLSIKLDYTNLKRVRLTVPQIELKAEERRKNVSGAFEVRRPEEIKGKKALLVDDVYTTGATIRECSKVLRKAGAEVFVLTIARAVKV